MKRLLLAGLLAILVAACQPADGDDEISPGADTLDSGAPLEGVGPNETQDDISDEGP